MRADSSRSSRSTESARERKREAMLKLAKLNSGKKKRERLQKMEREEAEAKFRATEREIKRRQLVVEMEEDEARAEIALCEQFEREDEAVEVERPGINKRFDTENWVDAHVIGGEQAEDQIVEQETYVRSSALRQNSCEPQFSGGKRIKANKGIKLPDIPRDSRDLNAQNTYKHKQRRVDMESARYLTGNRRTDTVRAERTTDAEIETGSEESSLNGKVLSELMHQSTRARLPQRILEPFGGEVGKYKLFKIAFRNCVDKEDIAPYDKLELLHQFTTGVPRRLVESCLYLEEHDGYYEAWRMLNEKYGTPAQICVSAMNNVLSFPTIHRDDARALESFAIELKMTKDIVGTVQYGNDELNNPKTIKELAGKLPFNMQEKWRQRAFEVRDKFDRIADFDDFLSLVLWEAKVANDPIYGKENPGTARVPNDNSWALGTVNKSKVVVGLVKKGEVCPLCKGDHNLGSCTSDRYSMSDKYKYFRDNNLCFGCARSGHVVNNCTMERTCDLCEGSHLTVMHRDKSMGKAAVSFEMGGTGPQMGGTGVNVEQ